MLFQANLPANEALVRFNSAEAAVEALRVTEDGTIKVAGVPATVKAVTGEEDAALRATVRLFVYVFYKQITWATVGGALPQLKCQAARWSWEGRARRCWEGSWTWSQAQPRRLVGHGKSPAKMPPCRRGRKRSRGD